MCHPIVLIISMASIGATLQLRIVFQSLHQDTLNYLQSVEHGYEQVCLQSLIICSISESQCHLSRLIFIILYQSSSFFVFIVFEILAMVWILSFLLKY